MDHASGNRVAEGSRAGLLRRLVRLTSIADDPRDDDDARRRKRVGVVAGYLTIVVPLSLPLQGGPPAVTLPLAVGLSAFSIANLVLLARTRAFERFVVLLIGAGAVFVPAATFLGGGITGSSSGLVWGFMIPAYAILALGPRRATRWYLVYLALVVLMAIVDPIARATGPQSAYALQLFGQVQNSVIPLTIVFLLLRYTDLRRIAAEARVDELLTNAIPAPIAARLRTGERQIADRYPATTIVFADLVGFTPWAQRTEPERVVAVLDELFTAFDQLAAENGVEKVKTIGDAYMAVAGAPEPRADHAQAAVQFSRGMLEAVAAMRQRLGIDLEIRVGIASGPVVGGVIGERRLTFDLWGDTVNLASRLESSGLPGRIQVASSTRDLLGNDVGLEEREIDIKGMGRLSAYLCTRLRPHRDGIGQVVAAVPRQRDAWAQVLSSRPGHDRDP